MFEKQAIPGGFRCTLDNGVTVNIVARQDEQGKTWIRTEREDKAIEYALGHDEDADDAVLERVVRARMAARGDHEPRVTVVDVLLVPA